MLDRLYLPILGAAAVAMVALALVWPQGLGARSPGPFGHTPVQQTPAMKAAREREAAAARRREQDARAAIRDLQTQAIAPSQ